MSETDPQSPKVSRPSKHFSDAELMRYARQIILPGWDIEAQSKLAEASVLVIGAGGLGCPLALSLCRAGVGALTLIDIDVVELSNLQRQSLFTEAHLGQSKAQVAASELKKHNPHVVLNGVQDRVQNATHEFLGGFDLIVDGSDNFATRDWLNSAAFDLALRQLALTANWLFMTLVDQIRRVIAACSARAEWTRAAASLGCSPPRPKSWVRWQPTRR